MNLERKICWRIEKINIDTWQEVRAVYLARASTCSVVVFNGWIVFRTSSMYPWNTSSMGGCQLGASSCCVVETSDEAASSSLCFCSSRSRMILLLLERNRRINLWSRYKNIMEKNLRSKRSQKVCHSLFKTSKIPSGNQDIVKSQGTIFPPFPPPGNPRAFDCRPCMGRWGIWALPSGSGEFELEVSSLSSGIQRGGKCRWGEEGLLKLYISLSFINLL